MRYVLLFVFFVSGWLAAQSVEYAAPLRGELRVTGTFGELRSDHFHAGLDFRAPTGTPVYSVADGFVSRIVVSPGGYGQAVYVDHPDGHRSVYAHLETLAAELLDTVRVRQFAAESFAVDLMLDSLTFPVARGQRIGAVGNRGYSFGSHLHFEMRERAGDVPVNPLAFGFAVADTQPPAIRKVRVYGYGMSLDSDGTGTESESQTLTPERVAEGRYVIRDTVEVGTPLVDFALKTYDRQDAMPNWNGVYGGALFVDSVRWFRFAFDRIPFADTEYLNALTDYADWTANVSWFHRYHALSPQQFMARPKDVTPGGIPHSVGTGKGTEIAVRGNPTYRLGDGAHDVRLTARDHAGNESVVDLVVRFSSLGHGTRARPHNYFLPAGEPSIIDNGSFRLELDATALYEDCYFRYQQLPDDSAGRLSPTHQLHDRLTPLHGRARLHLRPFRPPPDSLRDRAFIGSCSPAGEWTGYGGAWQADGRLAASIPVFGDYAIFLDTIPPTITINYFSKDLRRAAGFSLLIEDNVATGPLRYRGTVDGKWILLEYDLKNDKLAYDFRNGDFGPGEHLFELEVTDGVGNVGRFVRRFRR